MLEFYSVYGSVTRMKLFQFSKRLEEYIYDSL